MIISVALVLLAFGGWTSATFKQKCSKSCSNQVGFDCGWANVPCQCRALKAGLYEQWNRCLCDQCSDYDGAFGAGQLSTLAVGCGVIGSPIDRSILDRAAAAGTCDGNSNFDYKSTSDDDLVTPVAAPAPPQTQRSPEPSSEEPSAPPTTTVKESSTSYVSTTMTVGVTPVPATPTQTGSTTTHPAPTAANSNKTAAAKKQSSEGKKQSSEGKKLGMEAAVGVLGVAIGFGAVAFGL